MMLKPPPDRLPVLEPLRLLLQSRRVMIALCALVVSLVVLAIPSLAVVQTELLMLVLTLALTLIAGYSLEDAARAARQAAVQPPDTVPEQVKTLLNTLIDEWDPPVQPPDSDDS